MVAERGRAGFLSGLHCFTKGAIFAFFIGLSLVVFVNFQLRGAPSRPTTQLRPVHLRKGYIPRWIFSDSLASQGTAQRGPVPRAQEYPSKQCGQKYADFLKPVSTPQPAPAISPKEKGTNCRILVIVIFNTPKYDHVPFLRKLYEPFFTSVVFYGTNHSTSATFGVQVAKKTPGYLGNFQHFVISQATVEFPDYDGYLWVADDLVFNFKEAFKFLNPNKLWFSKKFYGEKYSPNIHSNRTDWWWPRAIGLPAARLLYGCIPEVYRARSSRWFGGPDRLTLCESDFGYIPRRFVEDFRVLAYSLRNVFMEITLPSTFYLMSNSTDDFEVVSRPPYLATWLWGNERSAVFQKLTKNTLILHAVKLSKNPNNQRRLLSTMNKEWNWASIGSDVSRLLHCQ